MNKHGKMNKRWEYIVQWIKKHKCKIIVEVGVWKGKTAEYVLSNVYDQIDKYYCVDMWEFYDEYVETLNPKGNFVNNDMGDVYKEFLFKTEPYWDKMEVLKMDSFDASKYIVNTSIDLCFIDANHEYEYVKRDIEIWFPKVRIGGIISGHDYNKTNDRYNGVVKAVDEKFDSDELNIMKRDNVWRVIKTKTQLNQ